MGAALTTQNSKSNLELRERIDYIAKNFIFNSDFTDMTKLGNEKYCNKLVKKVSEIFKKNKDSIDIILLRKELYDIKKNKNDLDTFGDDTVGDDTVGEDTIGEDTGDYNPRSRIPDKPVVAANDNSDDNMSPTRIQPQQPQQQPESIRTGGERERDRARTRTSSRSRPTSRKRMTTGIHNIKKKCNEVAKFYVLFAHLFSSIVSTINPSFEIDASSSSDKKNTSSGPLDFCSSRLDLLINRELIENSEGDITIRPNVCKMNLSESGTALRLVDLPGIKALLKLFKNGGDNYIEDVKYLYKAFTGKDAPNDINIEHIPLRVFSKDVECSGSGSSSRSESRGGANQSYAYEDDIYRYRDREEREIRNLNVDIRSGIYLTGVKGNPTNEKLFSDYIKNIKLMIQKSENNRSLLLEILSEMFTYTYESDGEISGVIINPSLTFKDLQSLVRRTRKIIIKLYTECEEDYNTGLEIFFALIQEKILSKLLLQDDALQEVAVRRKLNEYMVPNNLERSIVFNPYQQNPYQSNIYPNVNKNQFITPHFKQEVYREFKNILKKEGKLSEYSRSVEMDEWIADSISDATSNGIILDPFTVAKDFYEQYFIEQYDDDDEEKTSIPPSSAPRSSAPRSSAPPSSAPPSSAPPSSPPAPSSAPPSSAPPSSAPPSSAPPSSAPPSSAPPSFASPKKAKK